MMNAVFTLEEKAFLKGLNVSDKKELECKLREIEIEDEFTQEFINDLLKKMDN